MPDPSPPLTLPQALADLAALLERDFGLVAGEVVVRPLDRRDRRRLRVPVPRRPAVVLQVQGRAFSPTEQTVLEYLAGKGWVVGRDIAQATGYSRSSTFSAIL